MTNKTDAEILADAPEGTTHIYVDKIVKPLLADPDAYVSSYLGFGKWSDNDVNTQSLDFSSVRSLEDIEELVKLRKENAELDEEKLNMQISLTHVRESIVRISTFLESIEPRSHEAVITFNQCMEICAAIDEMDLPEFEFKGGDL